MENPVGGLGNGNYCRILSSGRGGCCGLQARPSQAIAEAQGRSAPLHASLSPPPGDVLPRPLACRAEQPMLVASGLEGVKKQRSPSPDLSPPLCTPLPQPQRDGTQTALGLSEWVFLSPHQTGGGWLVRLPVECEQLAELGEEERGCLTWPEGVALRWALPRC